jgi:hypothetical protein
MRCLKLNMKIVADSRYDSRKGARGCPPGRHPFRMKIEKRAFWNTVVPSALALALAAVARPADGKQTLPPREAVEVATDAYIYGYPLVTMDQARRIMTNVRQPEGMRAPLGQFARLRTFPTASNHDLTAPNADMLTTMAWLDVAAEPWVLSLPDTQGRYCLFSLLDGWTTVFQSLGKRTTGTGSQHYAITGPGWKGKLPAGLKRLKSPTGIVWVLGRIYCTGTTEDYAAAHALQDACSLVPLSSYGEPYQAAPGQVDPAIDMDTTAREQVNKLDASTFFYRLALLMKDNPPARADTKIVKRIARLGIIPGKPFELNRLDPEVIEALQNVPALAVARIQGWFKDSANVNPGNAIVQNGWRLTLKTGNYGTDYLQRAWVTAIGRGTGLPQDTVFAISNADDAGQPYSGNFRYVMHFPPGLAPAANGFWSLTMYDAEYFFVANPLSRYTLSARDEFKINGDGSLDFYLQHHPPGADREANWLPAPEGKFILSLRFYWPKESLLDGAWKIPPVKRAN